MSSSHCTNPGAKQTHKSQGRREQVSGLNTYKTGEGKSAIVISTDIFGYTFVNNQKIADRLAEGTGATVFIPDYFHGDTVDPNNPNLGDMIHEWLKKHPVTEACSIAAELISTIKNEYQSIQVK